MAVLEPSTDLARVVNLHEFEPLARQAMDDASLDYVAGGSWDEISLATSVEAWRRRTVRPRVRGDVSTVDAATTFLDRASAMPVAIAPMAVHGLAHRDGEVAMARAAAAAGIPFTLSTMSTRSIEEVAAAAPDAARWFQLYVQADPRRTRGRVERADAAGYGALVVTVDLPVLGYRERDRRNAFELPALGNFADAAGELGRDEDWLSRSITWADLATIRSWAPDLPLVLKGILTAEDARLAVEHDADAIVVSSHGARQLDRTVTTADALEEIVAAVGGRTELWVDGGIRRGLDVVTAVALGARGVLVGRPMLWALAAAGEAGVARALEILRVETVLAMTLLGTPTVTDINRANVAS